MRLKDNIVASLVAGEFAWDLLTARSKLKKKKKLEAMPEQQLARMPTRMKATGEEEGSDNETMARKTAKKWKKVLRQNGRSLSQLEEDLEMGFLELVVPRQFEEVKTSVFERAPAS